MKIRLILLILLLCQSACLAHEFWLEPESFQTSQPKSDLEITLRVGMNFKGFVWRSDLRKITKLIRYHAGRSTSLLQGGFPKKPRFPVRLDKPGQYLIGFNNENSFIELPAQEFEKYVSKEGLGHIVNERAKLGESKKAGTEVYQRSVKTLIQVGAKGVSTCYNKTLGLPLEVTPQADPYNPTGGSKIPFLVTFRGQPVAQAKVLVWHKSFGDVTKSEFTADAKGVVEVPVRRTGTWLVNTVYMERAEPNDKADWQSYWGSFTFGY